MLSLILYRIGRSITHRISHLVRFTEPVIDMPIIKLKDITQPILSINQIHSFSFFLQLQN